MEKHEKYKEIIILMALLKKKGIPFEYECHLNGYHIGYPVLFEKMCKISVIEHEFSYGHEVDKLEVMERNGKVTPCLSASQVLALIEEEEKKNRR